MKYFALILLWLSSTAFGAECTLYEKSHPTYLLNGAHLSTTKCSTCGSCHVSGVFTGTPKVCSSCHDGSPPRNAMARSTKHIPTLLIFCDSCHTTTAFTPATMNHTALGSMKCITCHLRGLSYTGGAQTMSLTHHQTNPVPTDCSMPGCHRPGGTVGKLYKQWDN